MRVDINPANGNEMYAVVNAAGTADDLGLWRTTNGGSSWSEISTPAGFPASKVYVGFADGGGWQPVGSRTLYLVGRGQQMQVVAERRIELAGGAMSQPQPGRDEDWDRQISDSTNGRPRPELTTSLLPHPTIARRAFAHSKSHNFRTDDAVNWRYSGEGFNGEIPSSAHPRIAFSDDPLRMAFAVTDSGYRMTENGGRSFHVGRVSGYTEANVALKNSCHSVAIHPTDPTLTIISSGFKAAGSADAAVPERRALPGQLCRNAERPRDGCREQPLGAGAQCQQADLLPAVEPRHADRRLRGQRPVARRRPDLGRLRFRFRRLPGGVPREP